MKNVQSWNSFKNLKTNNLPLSEKRRVEKRVGKYKWSFMSDDERSIEKNKTLDAIEAYCN